MADDHTPPIAAEQTSSAGSAFGRLGTAIALLFVALARRRSISAREQRLFMLRVEREIERAARRAQRIAIAAVDEALNEARVLFPDADTDLDALRSKYVEEITSRLRGAGEAASRRARSKMSQLIMRRIAWGLQAEEPQRAIAEAINEALAGDRRPTNVRDLVRDMNEQKLYRDSSGRNWKLNTYAEMVTRTNAARAHNEAVKALATEAGVDLVRVTASATACAEICVQYQGRIYSLSGVSDRYPRLPTTPPFHPNCVHRLQPVAGGTAPAP